MINLLSLVVNSKSDLTSYNYPFIYDFMEVSVADESYNKYIYIGNGVTYSSNWVLKETFSGDIISVKSFGAEGDGVTIDTEAFQNCANYCSSTGKTMFVPWSSGKYLIDRPIVPNRSSGLRVFIDGVIKNINPSFDRINLNGQVFFAGCLTYPYQSKIEDIGLGNTGSVYAETATQSEYLHRLTTKIYAGTKEIEVDNTLYNKLSIGEIVIIRSDLLAVDRTGEAEATATKRRYGVYDYSILNKIIEKKGQNVVVFEHPIDEDVTEARLVRFPTDPQVLSNYNLYIDGHQSDPRMPVGPIENFHLLGTGRGGVETTGNQSFIQATCLYNFSIRNIRILNAAGGLVCNSLNNGVIDGLYGNIRGSSLEIAFNSINVECRNIFPTSIGRGDRTNPNVSDGTNLLRNNGYGAIDSSGIIDYDFDAILYYSDNDQSGILYNKDDNNWNYFLATQSIWLGPTAVNTNYLTASGWGSDFYVPVGSVNGITMSKALTLNKSTINIHEGARNISLENSSVVIGNDYDFIDQDLNLVGSNIRINNLSVYSNKYIAINSGDILEGDSLSIGNVTKDGDVPFKLNDIDVSNVFTSGRPVNSIVSVNECPLFSSEDTTSISVSGKLNGIFNRIDSEYIISGVEKGVKTNIILSEGYLEMEKNKKITIVGFTGDWDIINGKWRVIDYDSNNLLITIDVDSTTIESSTFSGSPKVNIAQHYLLVAEDNSSSIVRFSDSIESVYSRYPLYYSSSLSAILVFSYKGATAIGLTSSHESGWYLAPTQGNSIEFPSVPGFGLTGSSDFQNVLSESNDIDFSSFSNSDNLIYLSQCGYGIYGPVGVFSDSTGDSISFVPNIPERTVTGIKFNKIQSKRSALRSLYIRGGLNNTYNDINFDYFVPSDVNTSNVPLTRFLIDIATKNPQFILGNKINNVQTKDPTLSTLRELVRDQGISNIIRNISDVTSMEWSKLYRRYFRQTIGGTLRNIFDYSPTLGVELPLISGKITGDELITFDTLNWSGAAAYRLGYGLKINISGVTKGSPVLNIKGGNPTKTPSVNILTDSERFNQTLSWTTSITGTSVTPNTHLNPINNIKNADTLTFASNVSSRLNQNLNLSKQQDYTFSIYAKSDTNKKFRLRGPNLQLSDDFTTSSTWQRFSYTFQTPTTINSNIVSVYNDSDGLAGSIVIWGAQLELGSTASAYTRNVDTNLISNLDDIQFIKLPYNTSFDLNVDLKILDPIDQKYTSLFITGITSSNWNGTSSTQLTVDRKVDLQVGRDLFIDGATGTWSGISGSHTILNSVSEFNPVRTLIEIDLNSDSIDFTNYDKLSYIDYINPIGNWCIMSWDLKHDQSHGISRYYEKSSHADKYGPPYVFVCGDDDISQTDESGLGFWDGNEIKMVVAFPSVNTPVNGVIKPSFSSNSVRFDLLSSGGTRQIAFEVETLPDEELNIYSYSVEPYGNIKN